MARTRNEATQTWATEGGFNSRHKRARDIEVIVAVLSGQPRWKVAMDHHISEERVGQIVRDPSYTHLMPSDEETVVDTGKPERGPRHRCGCFNKQACAHRTQGRLRDAGDTDG
jgi:hypothetical protein